MSFDSYTYVVFLAAVLLLHRLLPWRLGRLMLLVASYVFYGAGNPWHCLLLLISTVVDYNVARRIERNGSEGSRKLLLASSLVINLGLLASFKYGPFVVSNLNVLLGWLQVPSLPVPGWALPLGISFYTFQTLSYTVDVYYGKERASRDFAGFALYVSFFPQLVAGPIERYSRLMPQLAEKRAASAEDMQAGFQRVLWGLTKKMVLADRLGLFVDGVYAAPAEASSPALIVATASFALQIYMDFSGYCDIAIGTARMLGINLTENFRWPMLARNPIEFWSRWHITLGTWFRDYLLTALISRRERPPAWRRLLNLSIVMILMGLWHGPGWNFILLGVGAGVGVALYEAAYMISGLPRSKPLFGASPLATVAAVGMTNLHIVILALLFRSPTVGHALEVAKGMVRGSWQMDPSVHVYGAAVLLIWAGCIARGIFHRDGRRDVKMPAPLRASMWIGLLLAILYGSPDTSQQFIYFQF